MQQQLLLYLERVTKQFPVNVEFSVGENENQRQLPVFPGAFAPVNLPRSDRTFLREITTFTIKI